MKNLEIGQDAILITGPTASGQVPLSPFALAKTAQWCGCERRQHAGLRHPACADGAGRPKPICRASCITSMAMFRHRSIIRPVNGFSRLPLRFCRPCGARGAFLFFVGGTGLYFKALTGGLSDMPAVPAATREPLCATVLLAEGGRGSSCDPVGEKTRKPLRCCGQVTGQRIARALEIFEATGQSIRVFQGAPGPCGH